MRTKASLLIACVSGLVSCAEIVGEEPIAEGVVEADLTSIQLSKPTTGDLKLLVIGVNFQNDTAVPAGWGAIDQTFDQVSDFIQTASYGAATLLVEKVGLLTLPMDKDCRAHASIRTAAYAAASAAGTNPADFQYHVIIFPRDPNPACNWSAIAGVAVYVNGGTTAGVLTHEVGHLLGGRGLMHANAYVCRDGNRSVPFIPGAGACTDVSYGDDYDTMGPGGGRHYNPIYKEIVGWLGAEQIQEVSTSGIYTLSPYEVPGGVKALRVVGQHLGIPAYEYVLSYQQDAGLGVITNDNVLDGVLFRVPTTDPIKPRYTTTHLLTMGRRESDVALEVGQTFVDPGDLGIRFTVLDNVRGPSGRIRVQIDFPQGAANYPSAAASLVEPVVVSDPRRIGFMSVLPAPFNARGFQVEVKDALGRPVPGAVVSLDFSRAAGVRLQYQIDTLSACSSRRLVTKLAGADGKVTFLANFAGYANAADVHVIAEPANEALISSVLLRKVSARSPDLDADGTTGLADLAWFGENMSYDPRAPETDFDLNGVTGLGDFSIFGDAYASGLTRNFCP